MKREIKKKESQWDYRVVRIWNTYYPQKKVRGERTELTYSWYCSKLEAIERIKKERWDFDEVEYV